MAKIHIEVSKTVLNKMDKLGMKYSIVNDDVGMYELINSHTDLSELECHEHDQIIDAAKKAVNNPKACGIYIETRSGRDNQDHRCYWLDHVIVKEDEDDCTFTIAEIKKALK